MDGDALRAFISELGVSQAEFGRLVGVSSRGVALWISGDRTVPGPVEAYVRLLSVLPPNLKQIEMAKLLERGTGMRDGMFGIQFQGQQGTGMGVLVFDAGRVFGTDTEGARYDGGYVFDEKSLLADVKLKVTFPPNVRAVFGISNPYEWSIDVSATLDPTKNSGSIAVRTSIGRPINAQYRFLRALPEVA